MKHTFKIFFILFFILSNTCWTQVLKYEQTESAIITRLKKDLSVLSSDSFMGRETGTQGEIMARDYIISQYKNAGIQPFFSDNSYTQTFTYKENPILGKNNILKISKHNFILNDDYYPLSYSSSSGVKGEIVYAGFGISIPSSGYNDYKNLGDIKGKIFVIETMLPKQFKQDSNFIKFLPIQRKIDTAIAHGAAGIIFINSEKNGNKPSSKIVKYIDPSKIPIIFAQNKASRLLRKSKKDMVEMNVDIDRKITTGYNIAAYIDNHAPATIIIGGHYDHIGMGKENSRNNGLPLQVHNGADDNASGTVAVMELAKYFKNSDKKNHNYLFLNFSGEEKGLLGSAFFTKSTFFDTTTTSYMLNMDMVGRYDTSKVGFNIIGTGTSPLWDTLIALASKNDLKIKKNESGFDGSDQMSFYLKNIPVLFFFTGIHPDYHMPTDDIEKINFEAEARIIKFAERIIEITDTIKKMPFSFTKNKKDFTRPSMSVTLGVVPDHSYDGKGLRILGTTPGKTAEKAGLKANDIILKIGEYETTDIMSYMKALGYFKKGDKTKLLVKRGEESLIINVEF